MMMQTLYVQHPLCDLTGGGKHAITIWTSLSYITAPTSVIIPWLHNAQMAWMQHVNLCFIWGAVRAIKLHFFCCHEVVRTLDYVTQVEWQVFTDIYIIGFVYHFCKLSCLKTILPLCRQRRSEPRPCTSPSQHQLGSHQPSTPSPQRARLLRGNLKCTQTLLHPQSSFSAVDVWCMFICTVCVTSVLPIYEVDNVGVLHLLHDQDLIDN